MNHNAPLFKSVFGDSWESLPVVFKKHYQNKPFTNDVIEARGHLDIQSYGLKLFRPFYQLLGMTPVINAQHVPVLVKYSSSIHSTAFNLERIFLFNNLPPYHFCSTMFPGKGNEVIDVMRFGLAWRIRYAWQNNKLILAHHGYAVKFFGKIVPLPITFLLGRIDAYEYAIDNNHFGMKAEIRHWLLGLLYSYAGEFEIK